MSDTNKPNIIIYKTSWCAFCHTEMQWLEKLGIPYVAKDVEADKEAYEELLKKSKGSYSGVPVTDIGGDMILGFDRPKLQAAMDKHGIKQTA